MLSRHAGQIANPSYIAALLMPYLAVGLGLHVFHNAWVAILAYHAGILLILRWAKFSGASFRVTTAGWKILAFATLGVTGGLALSALWPRIFIAPSLNPTLSSWGLNSASWPWFIVYGGLVNPWLEEVYWRGGLGSATRSPILNDAAFAGFHLLILAPFISVAWLVAAFILLASTGWLWRQVSNRSGSLLPSALCHLAADVSILLVIVSEVT